VATGRAAQERGVVSDITIRELAPHDLDPVRWVIYRAYHEVLLELYGRESAMQYEVRSLDFMAMYLRRDLKGSFVAETEDGKIAGVLFCFVWGEVGWFGSLAVAPELQGRGVAQRLTRRAIDYLRERGCARIGLETWPEAARTRHLYEKLGFVRGRQTIKLSRAALIDPTAARSAAWIITWVTPADRSALERALEWVDEITRSASTGEAGGALDLRNEVRVPVISSFGELVVLHEVDGPPRAFALVFTRKPSGAPVGALDVRLMLAAPAQSQSGASDERVLEAMLAALDERAHGLGVRTVTCDVNLSHARAAQLLRERGYRPIYELIRMELPRDRDDGAARSSRLEYARWAG
jgi:ribosomal protein S18 acetylase RimI-like enzyme